MLRSVNPRKCTSDLFTFWTWQEAIAKNSTLICTKTEALAYKQVINEEKKNKSYKIHWGWSLRVVLSGETFEHITDETTN